jgi:molybdopterin converting factor small subunit
MAELKSFVDTLKILRAGEVIGDLTADLAQLVAAVRDTGGKGKLILTLTVKSLSGDDMALMVVDEIKVTPPKRIVATTVLYATEDNELQRKDPRQPELTGLRTPGTVSPIKGSATEDVG